LRNLFRRYQIHAARGVFSINLIDILVIAVIAVIAGAETWTDIANYGAMKKNWLATFLDLNDGVPSHDTFRRVFTLINPNNFEQCFYQWVTGYAEALDREVIAIDGKTVRRSFNKDTQQGPLHIVSAFATEQGLSLGQRAVDGKSNEITTIPELLIAFPWQETSSPWTPWAASVPLLRRFWINNPTLSWRSKGTRETGIRRW
jgi:predicted transposase YbfD/YdcC